jgi:hypothetical protein
MLDRPSPADAPKAPTRLTEENTQLRAEAAKLGLRASG